MNKLFLFAIFTICIGCAGIKVINPADKNQNEGTLALDLSSGSPKLVATYTCQLKTSSKKFSAIGKSEDEARKEVLLKCKDHTVVSFCEGKKISCVKN